MKIFLAIVIVVLVSSDQVSSIVANKIRSKRLNGGYDAYPGEFPYQVALESIQGHFFCGGSVVHRQYVLTAAHCVLDKHDQLKIDRMEVVAGTNDLYVTPATKVYVSVDIIYVPSEYSYMSDWYLKANLAVLKLRQPFNLCPGCAIQVLNPPEVTRTYADEEAVVTGFGYDKMIIIQDPQSGTWQNYGQETGVLRYAITRVWNNSSCGEVLRRPIPDTLMCTKIQPKDKNKPEGLCGGDGGGALVFNRSVLIGVASFSPAKCEEVVKPGVYTRVSSYIKFIFDAIDGKIGPHIKTFVLK